jgi:hypothetical protein
MIEIFEKWFTGLTESQKSELIKYIAENKITSLNEGYFSGPSAGGEITKGLFSGPASSQRSCPVCKKPM